MLIIDELDGVAHSRHERQMHTDDKASVNELLIQVDRGLKLGRMLAATTNFIGLLDEALTRSGRFGRFIPVAPPDLDEATQIVVFYLAALAGASGADSSPTVRIPDESRVRAILEPLYAQGLGEGRFFCGADLEAAVNGAYVRSVREALPADGWGQGGIEDVVVTVDVLADSLSAAPRSAQAESIEQFLSDIDRYCGGDLASTIARRLRPGPVVIHRGPVNGSSLVGKLAKLVSRPFSVPRR
jgi:SpoVK/Ycf46/Vps4 family AAA+-type ATPase